MWYLNETVEERWGWTKIFSAEECKSIIDMCLSKKQIISALVENPEDDVNKKYRNTDIYWLTERLPEDIWIYQRCTAAALSLNKSFFNYDLLAMEDLQFTIYNEGQFYKKHIDTLYKAHVNRKLSFTIQLSDPSEYEGGDVLVYYGEEPETLKKDLGAMSIFPSNTLHEVKPVTSGVRYCLVGWCNGPRLK
jgi:PKHD-type hydroxylase